MAERHGVEIGYPFTRMPTADAIKVFVIDDHPAVRMGIKMMLETDKGIRVVGSAASANDFLAALPKLQIDIVLTDLRMTDISGEQLLAKLRVLAPNIRCAVLTNYHSDEDVFSAIKAGAMAYILKTAPMEHLLEAVHRVYEGEEFIPPHIARQLAQRIAREDVSPREVEVLSYVARGLSNEQIAERMQVSKFTVRNHLSSVCHKLKAKDRAEALAIALTRGLLRLHHH